MSKKEREAQRNTSEKNGTQMRTVSTNEDNEHEEHNEAQRRTTNEHEGAQITTKGHERQQRAQMIKKGTQMNKKEHK